MNTPTIFTFGQVSHQMPVHGDLMHKPDGTVLVYIHDQWVLYYSAFTETLVKDKIPQPVPVVLPEPEDPEKSKEKLSAFERALVIPEVSKSQVEVSELTQKVHDWIESQNDSPFDKELIVQMLNRIAYLTSLKEN